MTIFGPDISSYEHGVNVRALTDPFILFKVTEGTYYVDADYEAFLAQARATGKLAIPYHFVTTQDPGAQARFIAVHIGDKSLPLMLDFEPQGQTGSRPTVAQLAALVDACLAEGLRPRLCYVPRWYWQQLGSPPLSPLATRGQGLISSAYPGGSGYPGDGAAGWQPYGGMTPLLYQYTDAAYEGGQKLGDMNAYRGTREQLAAFLGATSTTTTGGDMALTSQDVIDVWSYKNLTAGDKVDAHQQLVNAATNSAASSAKLDQVLAALKQQPMAADAIAAAIVADLKTAGAITVADPAAIATAVVTVLEQHNLGGLSAQQLAEAFTAAAGALNTGGGA